MSTELIACEPLRGGVIVHVLFHRLQCPPTSGTKQDTKIFVTTVSPPPNVLSGVAWGGQLPEPPMEFQERRHFSQKG